MENLKRIVKLLYGHNIKVSILYDMELDMFYVDLQTGAKSHLYLYENGELIGRYNYQSSIDFTENEESILKSLCYEFLNCLKERDFYNSAWSILCKTFDITINL